MSFTKRDRQKIIDDYLQNSGENMFVASAFIDWLSDKPEHQAYPWFFAKDDATAAREYRIGLARQMASGLRIVSVVSTTDAANVVHIVTHEYPAYVSPMAGRRTGGGYERFDPEDAEHIAELQRQGARALRSWLDRYADVFAGYDLAAIEAIAEQAEKAKSA
jgi:hypothetical protein